MSQSPVLSDIKLSPKREKSALHFHFSFVPSQHHPSTIEFELSAHEAMCLLSALQSVQRQNGWRVPQFFGRNRGRPNLRVVKKND